MDANQLFSVANSVAMAAWLVLIVLPRWRYTRYIILYGVIILFCLLYSWLIFSNFSPGDFSGFGTLSGVQSLFADPQVLLAGWVHYLAFDLLSGLYILSNAQQQQISHWLIIPSLSLTFMFGPVGLLLFLIIKGIKNAAPSKTLH